MQESSSTQNILNSGRMILSLIGIYSAGSVTWEMARGEMPTCAPGFQCASVLLSPWFKFGPVSMSYLGFIYFLLMFFVALGLLTEFGAEKWRSTMQKTLKILTIAGALFAVYAFTVMGVVLQAWCPYCLISAIALAGIALIGASEHFFVLGAKSSKPHSDEVNL